MAVTRAHKRTLQMFAIAAWEPAVRSAGVSKVAKNMSSKTVMGSSFSWTSTPVSFSIASAPKIFSAALRHILCHRAHFP
jgi:hypothetical protein